MTPLRHISVCPCLRGKRPCASHYIAINDVKAITYIFFTTCFRLLWFLKYSTHYCGSQLEFWVWSFEGKLCGWKLRFCSRLSFWPHEMFWLSNTISGDNVPRHSIMQLSDFSGHGNLAAWMYLHRPVTVLNFPASRGSQKHLKTNMTELMSSCSCWSSSVRLQAEVKCSCWCTLMDVKAFRLQKYPAVQKEIVIHIWLTCWS